MSANHEYWMKRCLELAQQGLGLTAPNPMVGCVIVLDNKIIGEGFTSPYGGNHAEVNAINAVSDKTLLKKASLYVSLEPCSHFGKTPPCVDLILKYNIPKVIIACSDTNELVNGKGIAKMQRSGVDVVYGILEKEARTLNKRFFTFHKKKRPYIILKWAETLDGFMDKNRTNKERGQFTISNKACKVLSHKWRTQEQAILVGNQTSLTDNPELTSRLVTGENPVRFLIDRSLKTPKDYNLYNNKATTFVFNALENSKTENNHLIKLNFKANVIRQILDFAYQKNIQSIIVEGGKQTLTHFINNNLWDEARVFTGEASIGNGLSSPKLITKPTVTKDIEGNQLKIFYNSP